MTGITFLDAKKITQAKLNEVQMKIALLLMSTEYRGINSGVPATWIADELELQGNLAGELEALVKKGLVKKIKNASTEFFIFDTSDEQPTVKDFSLMLVSRAGAPVAEAAKD